MPLADVACCNLNWTTLVNDSMNNPMNRTNKKKRLPIILLGIVMGISVLASGCKSNDEKSIVWGTYQEPVTPQTLPEAVGASELKVLWRKNLGPGAEQGYALLKPAYTAAGDGVYAASRTGKVFKLDPKNGATLWQRDLNAEIFSGVGVGDSLAVVALDNGTLVALRGDTGEVLWESPLGRQISAIPVVGQGRVVARTAGGAVVGLRADSGELAWSFEREVPGLSIHGDSTPVISGDVVLAGLANGRLVANNVVTGREYWETEVSFASGRNELERLTDSDTSPLVSATVVYAATYQGNVAALQLQNAEVIWKAEVSSRLPMSLGGARLLVTGDLGAVLAIDVESGKTLWTQDGFRGHGMSRPLAVGERVVVGDAAGNLYSLNLNDGTLLEKRKVVSSAVIALVPGPDQFAVFSSKGNLSAVTLSAPQ